MTRINSNVNALIAQRVLSDNNKLLTQSLERLSTGVAVNRGADGPARLIAGEKLRRDQAALSAAIGNAERADLVSNIAEGGLQEISNLLVEVQSLIGETANDAGVSAEEKEANQLQIDSILQTIDRIAATTSFGGTKLLNGSLDFTVSGVSNNVSNYSVNGAKVPQDSNVNVTVNVITSAQRGGLFLSTDGDLDLTSSTSRFTFELGGALGSRSFSFSSGATRASIRDSINSFKSVTGVSATQQGTGLILKSTGYGSDQFVSFDIIDRAGQAGDVHFFSSIDEDVISTEAASITDFTAITSPVRDDGQDVVATVNGVNASGSGRTIKVNSEALELELELSSSAATAVSSFTALTVTGGGAKFNLGPSIDIGNQVRLGIGNVAARNLGKTEDSNNDTRNLSDLGSGGVANVVSGDLELAQEIVGKAVDDISSLRGRIGAFQKNVVQSTITSLNIAFENTSAALSAVRDTDFAAETANLTRSQILVSAATNVVGIANARPATVLQLLG